MVDEVAQQEYSNIKFYALAFRYNIDVHISTKKIINYSILTITWNKKEENEKLKSIWVAE